MSKIPLLSEILNISKKDCEMDSEEPEISFSDDEDNSPEITFESSSSDEEEIGSPEICFDSSDDEDEPKIKKTLYKDHPNVYLDNLFWFNDKFEKIVKENYENVDVKFVLDINNLCVGKDIDGELHPLDKDDIDRILELKLNYKKTYQFNNKPTIFGFRLRKGFKLHEHQEDAIMWNKDRSKSGRCGFKGGVLALDMGLGKTISTCGTIASESYDPTEMLISAGLSKNVINIIKRYENCDFHTMPNLVVCPKSIIYEWKNDIEKFFGDTLPYFVFTKQSLGKKFDDVTFKELRKYKIILTTYETVMNIVKKCKTADRQFILDDGQRKIGIKNARKPNMENIYDVSGGSLLVKTSWNWVVADESHRFANPKSATFYAMMCLYGDKKLCLSGTPLRNFQSDLYSQFRFCGFDMYMYAKQFNYNVYERNRLYEFILCKDYKDAKIELPDVVEHEEIITLEGREKEIYEYYKNASRLALEEFAIGTTNFANVLTLFLRLRQVCISAYTILEESSRNYKGDTNKKYTKAQEALDKMTQGLATWVKDRTGTSGIKSAKVMKIMDIIGKIPRGEKVLVFTSFKKVIDVLNLAITEKYPNKKFLNLDGDVTGDERNQTLDIFKDPNAGYDVMFVSYKVGSEGLNLTEANHVIMCENWWCQKVLSQARRRAHRVGQKKIVHMWKILIQNSIEERIEEVCRQKEKLCEDFLISKKKFSTKLNASMLRSFLR